MSGVPTTQAEEGEPYSEVLVSGKRHPATGVVNLCGRSDAQEFFAIHSVNPCNQVLVACNEHSTVLEYNTLTVSVERGMKGGAGQKKQSRKKRKRKKKNCWNTCFLLTALPT